MIFSITAPSHLHATGVAVYPALLFSLSLSMALDNIADVMQYFEIADAMQYFEIFRDYHYDIISSDKTM